MCTKFHIIGIETYIWASCWNGTTNTNKYKPQLLGILKIPWINSNTQNFPALDMCHTCGKHWFTDTIIKGWGLRNITHNTDQITNTTTTKNHMFIAIHFIWNKQHNSNGNNSHSVNTKVEQKKSKIKVSNFLITVPIILN